MQEIRFKRIFEVAGITIKDIFGKRRIKKMIKFQQIDLSNIPEDLYGKWIAIDKKDNSVIAEATSMKEVTAKAREKTKDQFLVTVVKPCSGGYLL